MVLEFTFGQWLRKQVERDDTIGEIARHYVAPNTDMVRCCTRFQQYFAILKHMHNKHHSDIKYERMLLQAYDEYRGIVRFR